MAKPDRDALRAGGRVESPLRAFSDPKNILSLAASYMVTSSSAIASIYDRWLPAPLSLLSLRFRRHQSHREGSHKAQWHTFLMARARAES